MSRQDSPRVRRAYCAIIPPYLLEHLVQHGGEDVALRARQTLTHDEDRRAARVRRETQPTQQREQAAPKPDLDSPGRVISSAKNVETLPGTRLRAESEPASPDGSVNQAYDGLGDTWTLYKRVFDRASLDDKGLPLLATVHYGRAYDNAFWDGTQMVFGDGDGKIFGSFTASLDVIGHELTHGVTEYTAGLVYRGQPGALNESMSDVFGSLVKQQAAKESAEQADWLIGAELLMPGVKGVALRSMKAPGTAYDDPQLGKDPQPATMAGYVETTQDNGGVHINSGIPNRAFYLAASAIGGYAWEKAGQIWYDALTGDAIRADCDFATFGALTVEAAMARFGATSTEATAVRDAWHTVGVDVAPTATKKKRTRKASPTAEPANHTEVLIRRSGGFGGITRETKVDLRNLPETEASQWQTLLDGPLARMAADAAQTPARPDGFNYEVEADGGQAISLPENAVPGAVRDLMHRTLNAAPADGQF